MKNTLKSLTHKFQRTMKKMFERFTYGITVLSVIFWSLGPAAFPLQATAATGTAISDATNGFLRLKASSAFASAVKITIGSNDNNKTLNEILLSMKSKSGTPTFTAETSTDLADLSASSSSGSGVTLWRDNGNGTFSATDDTNISLSSPLFGATAEGETAFPIIPAAVVTLATDQVYFIVVKSKAAPVHNNAFSIKVTSITAATAPLTINFFEPPNFFETPPIGIDTQGPSITSFNGSVGTTGAQIRFNEPVQKVGGGNIAWVSASDPLTYVDAPEDAEAAQSTTALSHTAGQDVMNVTFSRNITSADLVNTIAPAANKIMDMAGNVAAATPRTMGNPIQISTPSLPNGSVSAVYTATLAGSGGMGATAWSVATAADATSLANLGLTLNATTGVLGGTIPGGVSAGTYNVNFKYRDNVTTATVTTGAAGANAWTINAGNYMPALGDIVLYRNITDAPTVATWGVVTTATNTNQNTFKINGALLTASKSYQITKLYVVTNTSVVSATNTYTQGLNFVVGDIVVYPANADGTGYTWGVVTTAANIAPGGGPGTLQINGAVAPTYTGAGQISKFTPFVTSNITVGAAGANTWTVNSGNYDPLPGDVVVYRNVTSAPTVVSWGVVTGNPGMTKNQNDFKINGVVLTATNQYQISKISGVQTSNIDGFTGKFVSNTMIFDEGDLVFAPLSNSSTTPNFNWAFVTSGAGTYVKEGDPSPSTPVVGIKLNGSATGVTLNDFAYAPPITKLSPTSSSVTRSLSIGVSSASGGAPPGIASVSPDFGAVGTTVASVVVTGTNTSFSASSIIELIKPSDQTVISTTSTATNSTIQISNVSSTGPTNLKFRAVIGSAVVAGQYHIRIGQVFAENRFNVGAAVASGLNLITPTSAATGVQIPPLFTFNPSSNASITSYRITVKTTQDFSGSAVWDFAFPKPADASNSNNSPCTASNCSVQYGPGMFNIITQPTPLSANTQYYWKVQTYSVADSAVTSAVALESTDVRSFTTTASVTDSELPNVTHRPVTAAIKNVDLVMFARIFDNIATPTSNPALSGTLLYCIGSACTPTTEINGVSVGSGYFSFTIPSNIVTNTLGTIIRYKLRANDGSNTKTFDNSGQPFQVTTVNPGTASILGTVKNSSGVCSTDPNIRQATVFLEGTGFSTTSSNDANCNFTLSNLPTSTYSVVAVKDGFGDRKVDAQTGMTVPILLTQGVQGGIGGDVTNPRVKLSGPPDGQMAPPNDSNFRVFVVFDKPMSQNSVTVANALTVNDLNPTNGTLTNITNRGTWAYYPSNPNTQGLPPESNMAVWTFSQTACGGPCTFGSNKTIAVKVTGSVTDTAGNPIFANKPDGSYTFSFTTNQTTTFTGFNATTGAFAGGGTFGSGQFIPPHVNDTTPPDGKFDVPINTKPLINFSDAMADDGGGYLLKDAVKLFEVNGSTNAETDVSATAISAVTLDTGKMSAKVTLLGTYNGSTGLFKSNAKYRLKVLGIAKSANGMTLAPPNQGTSTMFTSEFKTSGASDTAAPVVVGSFPDNNATNVSTMLGALNVSFSKDLDSSTISASTVKLEIGGTAVNGMVEYKPMDRAVYFMPQAGLTLNTTYTLTVTTGVTGGNGTAIAQTVRTFTTASSVDTTTPKVEYVNVDDTSITITFSKPMNAAKATDDLLFPTSILKTSNIVLKYGDPGFNAQTSENILAIPTTAVLSYDSTVNTLQIKGYRDPNALSTSFIGKEVYAEFVGAKDLAGTAMVDDNIQNVGKARIQNSATTKGALGPMAMSADQSSLMGKFVPQNMSTATFGFAPPVDVKPFNMMAGKTTIYGVRLPVSTQIPSGGRVVLTFPVGFDVSGAQQDINSPMRTDLNGPGTGTLTFKCNSNATAGRSCGGGAVNADETGATGGLADDGVSVNTSLRTVTVFINGATGATNDFLTIDISGIKNSTVPKDFNTSGYTIDVKTKNADGTTVLESLTSMPFFIQQGGSFTLSGTITATGNDQAGTMKVYLHSPMTGPVDATTVNFSDAISLAADGATQATYEVTGLSAGEYFLSTDQSITLGAGETAKEFVGKSMPERIMVSGNTAYNMTLASASAAGTTAVTVRVSGPANEPIDIFAGSQIGFKAKQVTLNANADDYENFTINVSDGDWFVGVGPQMPKGPMAGPPPTPSYVMQKPVEITATNGGNPAIKETSDTANDGILKFTLTGASKSIKGLVKDGNNKVMANAEVYAYSPQGGFGTHAQSDMAGAFTLAVNEGLYIVGSFVPGMPPSKEVPVIVNTDGTLLIDGATTAITANAAATSFVLKVAKPDYTISGKVTDGTNVIQGASVNAFCDGSVMGNTCFGSGANANTDSSGNYTLYVRAGTWKVNAFLPGYGQLTEQSVVVSTANATNINFTPSSTGTFKSVAGIVTKGGVAVQGAFVRIDGNGTRNEAITDKDGGYSLNVPTCATAGCYRIKGFIPGVGDLPPLTPLAVTDNITAGASTNFVIGASRAITFTLSAAVTSKTFVDVFSSTGQGNHVEIPENTTSITMSLPNGTYGVRAHIPGVPLAFTDLSATTGDTVYTSAGGTVVVDGATEGVTITVPTTTLRTVTGTVTDGTVALANAWVEIMNKDNGVHFGTQSAANGSFTLKVSDSAQSYSINAMKPGYFREPTSLTVNGANPAVQTLTLPTAAKVITGQVKIGSTGAANAFVRAEKQGGGFSGTQADANGNYSLAVSAGTWKVLGVAEGYAQAELSARVDMTTAATSANNDITLATQVTLSAPTSKPITPASGGTLEDTATGMKITIPANALGSGTSAGNVEAKETNNAPDTSTAKKVGNAQEIKATDSSGNPVTTLTDNVTVEQTFTKAELAAVSSASDSSNDTKTETDKIKMAYLDSTNWTTLSSSVKYQDTLGNKVTTVNEDLSNIASVTYSAETSHFSIYAPIVPVDPTPAAVPSGMTVGSATVSTLLVSWTAVVGATGYDIYRSTASDGVFARLGSEPTVSSGSTATYTDSGLSANTTYYYKMTSISAAGESGTTSVVNSTTSAAASASAGAVVVAQPAATAQPSAVTAEVKKVGEPVKTEVKAPATAVEKPAPQVEAQKVASTEEKPTPTIEEKVVKTLVKLTAPVAMGVKSAAAKTVQEVLRAEGLLTKLSGKIDKATTNAIKKFQKKYGIAKKGTPGYGTLGPKTRAAINEIVAEKKNIVAEAAQTAVDQKKAEAKPTVAQKPVEPAKPLPTPLIEEKIVKTLVQIEKRLTSGAKGAEVKSMQEVLKAKGIDIDTTGVFDKATKEAIKEFQLQEGILKEGDKTLGTLTVKTREAMNAIVKQEKSVAAQIAKAESAAEAQPQQLSEEVTKTLVKLTAPVAMGVKSAAAKTVQEVLRAEGLLTKLSGKIDKATTNAIKKFQKKYGIAKKGTPGYGTLGPKTRAAINEMTGK